MNIYAIKDKVANTFATPFYTPNDAVAVRMVSDAVNDETKSGLYNNHTDDFELWFLGEFDEDTGFIVSDIKLVIPLSSLRRE